MKRSSILGLVPTAAMKAGDFTLGGSGGQIYDPYSTVQLADGDWSRQPLTGNLVPASMIDPVAKNILDMNPGKAENQPGNFSTSGPLSNLLYDQRSNVFFDDWSFRGDHQVSPYVKFYSSYSYNDRRDLPRPTRITIPEFDSSAGAWSPQRRQNLSVGNTWIVSPTMANDARVGYFRDARTRLVAGAGDNMAARVGIPTVSAELLPGLGNQFGVSGLSGPNESLGETISIRNDFSVISGSHAYKMGYELLRFRLDSTSQNRPSGDFSCRSRSPARTATIPEAAWTRWATARWRRLGPAGIAPTGSASTARGNCLSARAGSG